jgi:DNA-directed RNA polymerase specialized sigma24 family protein
MLDVSVSAAQSRLVRARRDFRERIRTEDPSQEEEPRRG